jgi:hypothetical protein
VRTVSLVILLCVALGCRSRGELAPAALKEPAAQRCPETRGKPLPTDCRGETRPVTSGATAACIARKVIPPEARPASGGAWHYSVGFRDSRWVVTIHDPSACVLGAAYLIHVDPKSGRVLKVQPQR